MLMANMSGTIFRAALVMAVASAISEFIATAVTGEAAGVARANWDNMNNSEIIPVGDKPIEDEKLNIKGMTKTITIILLATLVMTAAKARATTTKAKGGSDVNGVSKALIAKGIPVSDVFI